MFENLLLATRRAFVIDSRYPYPEWVNAGLREDSTHAHAGRRVRDAALPPAAVRRLGIEPDQENVLLRVVLRAVDRTLTHADCNVLRDENYAALHQGAVSEWAARG